MKKNQLLFGRKPVIDALQEGQTLDRIILQRGIQGHIAAEIRELAKKHHIPVQMLPKEALKRFGTVNHQGVIAYIPLIPYQDILEIVPFLFEQGKTPLILLLDQISDVRNFGAIARSAECLGAHAIVIPMKGSAKLNDIALKVSAGALQKIPVCRTHSLLDTSEKLKTLGLQIIVSDSEGDLPLSKCDLSLPLALIIGAEGEGVRAHLQRMSDSMVCIPQSGETESLNVSVATGIMLYEIARQRE